ncbi:TGS domain-containing protein [Candidatus Pacearchaeota archaeon]|nr:TGS domain-containing protein [Candidatus Pacearchaeota archaeon]
MPINAGYEYFNAEKRYLDAQTLEERISGLKEMIKTAPKHKGTENLLAELKTRLKKFLEKAEKTASVGKGKKGIRKEGFQVILVGFSNSGKSQLLASLTNAMPKISSQSYTTLEPNIGTMHYQGVSAQIVDLPAINSKNFDISLLHTADAILIVVSKLEDYFLINKQLEKATSKRILVFTHIDLLETSELRKLEAQLRSKRLNYMLVSGKTNSGISELKTKIFENMNVIRIYTKEPGKPVSSVPIVISVGSTVKKVAESIYKGFSKQITETRLTGPSGKFINQRVGIAHVLKDKDILEFKTR